MFFRPWENPYPHERAQYGCGHEDIIRCSKVEKETSKVYTNTKKNTTLWVVFFLALQRDSKIESKLPVAAWSPGRAPAIHLFSFPKGNENANESLLLRTA